MNQRRYESQAKEWADGLRKALKSIQSLYVKSKFRGGYEDNWRKHSRNFSDFCENYDVPNSYRV